MGYQLWLSSKTGKRRKGTSFNELQSLFIDNITTKHIYEPLLSCKLDEEACHVKHGLNQKEFDSAGVIDSDNTVVGYVLREDLENGVISEYIKPIEPERLVADSTPIAELLNLLSDLEYIYVLDRSRIEGIVTRADINKPIVRIYLFGIISLFELHLNYWINKNYTEDDWKDIINPERLKDAQKIFEERKGNNDELSLLECIQIADKKVILKKTESFRKDFSFSKGKVEKLIKDGEKIRNELAHSQNSIIANLEWKRFVETINEIELFLVKSEEKHEHTTKGHKA